MFSWNRLHRGVKAVFFAQIVNRMGDFVFPFLTLILTQVQGLPPAQAGLVVTLAMGLESVGGLVAGRLSDRHGRRDVLVLFLSCSGLLLAGAGFAPAHSAAAVAIVASGFFVGAMRPVLGALVADMSTPETRRAAFSLSYLGINLGVAVGPLMAGWLFHHALSWMFWIDGISTAAALVILLGNVPRHINPVKPVSVDETPRGQRGSIASFVHDRVLFPFGLLVLLYNAVYAQMVFTLGLQMVGLFGERGPQIYGTIWALNAVTVIGLTPVALRVTRRWSNLRSMAWGMGCFTLGTGIFLLRPGLALILASTVLWTSGEVLFSVHVGDLVTAFSPPEFRGRFQGYVQFLAALGFVVSPVAGGVVAQTLGLSGVWWFATAGVAIAGIGFALVDRRVPAARSRAQETP
jgi:MFS family permease